MRRVLVLVALTFAASVVRAADPDVGMFFSNVGDRYYAFRIPRSQVIAGGAWNPDKTSGPSLSPADAIRTARALAKQLEPSLDWAVASVHLQSLNMASYWLYLVEFVAPAPVGAVKPNLLIPVLFSGVAVSPGKGKTLAAAEAKTRPPN